MSSPVALDLTTQYNTNTERAWGAIAATARDTRLNGIQGAGAGGELRSVAPARLLCTRLQSLQALGRSVRYICLTDYYTR